MTEPNTKPWEAWNKERQDYRESDPQGFSAGLTALEIHIAFLKSVAPKDKAGWPDWKATKVIEQLQTELSIAKTWAGIDG